VGQIPDGVTAITDNDGIDHYSHYGRHGEMVNQCINQRCNRRWDSFYSGEVYALESNSARTEFFWLCADCTAHFTVRLDPCGIVGAIPRAEVTTSRIPHPKRDLRLIFRLAPIEHVGSPVKKADVKNRSAA
jgi:hypothetical protein